MSYSDVLNQYIEKSGLTLGEIAKKINAMGIKIDRSYISMLKNNKTKNPASEEINKAIAEVTGGDPDKLIFAAFADRAPDQVKRILDNINSIDTYLNQIFQKIELNNELIKTEINDSCSSEIDPLPMSELLKIMSFEEKLELLKIFFEDALNQNKSFEKYITNLDPVEFKQIPHYKHTESKIEGYSIIESNLLHGSDGFSLSVPDDRMSGDRIYEGDTVVISKQSEINSHDIAVVVVNDKETLISRVRKEGDLCLLMPSNPSIQPSLLKAKDVKIIGKVVEVKFQPK